jgi:hypothetical protein
MQNKNITSELNIQIEKVSETNNSKVVADTNTTS